MNGYLDTTGKLHECEHYGHLDLAWELVDAMKHPVRTRLDAERYLQELGWLVVRDHDIYGLIGYIKEDGKEERWHLTDEQKKWLNNVYGAVNNDCRAAIDHIFEWDKE